MRDRSGVTETADGIAGCLLGMVYLLASLAIPTLIGLWILDACGIVEVCE